MSYWCRREYGTIVGGFRPRLLLANCNVEVIELHADCSVCSLKEKLLQKGQGRNDAEIGKCAIFSDEDGGETRLWIFFAWSRPQFIAHEQDYIKVLRHINTKKAIQWVSKQVSSLDGADDDITECARKKCYGSTVLRTALYESIHYQTKSDKTWYLVCYCLASERCAATQRRSRPSNTIAKYIDRIVKTIMKDCIRRIRRGSGCHQERVVWHLPLR